MLRLSPELDPYLFAGVLLLAVCALYAGVAWILGRLGPGPYDARYGLNVDQIGDHHWFCGNDARVLVGELDGVSVRMEGTEQSGWRVELSCPCPSPLSFFARRPRTAPAERPLSGWFGGLLATRQPSHEPAVPAEDWEVFPAGPQAGGATLLSRLPSTRAARLWESIEARDGRLRVVLGPGAHLPVTLKAHRKAVRAAAAALAAAFGGR